jgi:DeoR/GlpR family transcriptional regulator of sugar metabolism
MTQEERLLAQQAWLNEQGKITLEQICTHFNISRDSARRDLLKLTQLPNIQRIRAGAIQNPVNNNVVPYQQKKVEQYKRDIANAAIDLIAEQDYILLDTGTTLSALAESLFTPTTIVTNSIDCIQHLSNKPDINVHLLGGQFDTFHRAILGNTAIKQLSSYHVNKAFIGVCALSENGVSTSNIEEANIKQAMIAQATQVILLCDDSKFNQQHFYHVCGWQNIDVIITNKTPPAIILQHIEQHDIGLIITDNRPYVNNVNKNITTK